MARPDVPGRFLTEEETRRVIDAIGAAESRSRGEVRVHFERRCRGGDPVARARRVFERLGMTRTESRAGVLLYVATQDRRFAIVGDAGIDSRTGASFWEGLAQELQRAFVEGERAAGLVAVIAAIGEALAAHFPRDSTARDPNELPDELSYGDPEA